MASKDEIIAAIEQFRSDIEGAVGTLNESAWSTGVYESGWNARQLLSHIASTSGVT